MILHGSLRPTSRPLGLPILLTALIGSIPTRPVVCFGPRVDALGATLSNVVLPRTARLDEERLDASPRPGGPNNP